jgi:hypothetical protein
MTAYGEPAWPPAGNNPGHHRGDPLTASGDDSMAVDTALAGWQGGIQTTTLLKRRRSINGLDRPNVLIHADTRICGATGRSWMS